MATQFCEKCKQFHPGRVCDYNDEGECAETVDEIKKSSADVPSDPNPQSTTE